jgi:hypothetical protein
VVGVGEARGEGEGRKGEGETRGGEERGGQPPD